MATIPRDMLEQYIATRERRRQLAREIDKLERLEKPMAEALKAEAERRGGRFTRFGYLVSLMPRKGRPAWQDHFLAVAGEDAAARIEAATPPTMVLDVQPPTQD